MVQKLAHGLETCSPQMNRTIYTIGHSTRTIEQLIQILRAHSITLLVDVRTLPRSKHNPQFDGDALRSSLERVGIGYVHLKGLGGLRRPSRDSVNTGWRNEGFRGYADHMQTEEFRAALARLMELGEGQTVTIMCAEGNPFRCHRMLVADALTARGIRVVHVSSERSVRIHTMTPFAKVTSQRVSYPVEPGQITL